MRKCAIAKCVGKDENTQEDSGRLVSFPMRFRAGGAGVSTDTLGKCLDANASSRRGSLRVCP